MPSLIPPLEVEFDALEFIRLLNKELFSFAEINVIIQDILYFVNFVNIKFFFFHCPHENNKAAHSIDAFASSLGCSLI